VTVDAYAHCGRDKYLPVEALDAVMSASRVDAAVLCQHLGQFDNGYIAGLVRERPERFAGVALIDHLGPCPTGAVATVVEHGLRGVRITSDALREEPSLATAVADAGLVIVVYAPDGVGPVIPALASLATAYPATRIVVSHLGNPRVEHGRLASGETLLALAPYANVRVALSGLEMFCSFPYEPLAELIASVIDAFGPERMMWGSNYPVCGPGGLDYVRELELLRRPGQWGLSRAAAESIADTTARKVWFG
jgi:L-fuconolactonase